MEDPLEDPLEDPPGETRLEGSETFVNTIEKQCLIVQAYKRL